MIAPPNLTVQDLTFGFGKRIILDRLTFAIRAGGYWLQGVNGAGKSTLFKLLARALTPAGGIVKLNGQALATMTATQRRAIFLCGDELPRLDWMLGTEFVGLYCAIYPNLDRNALDLNLDRLGLEHLLHLPIVRLSSGERKKLFLAIALSVDAPLLLLDEPFNAIDTAATVHVRAALQKRVALSTQIVLLTSHANPGLSLHIAALKGGPESSVIIDGNADVAI